MEGPGPMKQRSTEHHGALKYRPTEGSSVMKRDFFREGGFGGLGLQCSSLEVKESHAQVRLRVRRMLLVDYLIGHHPVKFRVIFN